MGFFGVLAGPFSLAGWDVAFFVDSVAFAGRSRAFVGSFSVAGLRLMLRVRRSGAGLGAGLGATTTGALVTLRVIVIVFLGSADTGAGLSGAVFSGGRSIFRTRLIVLMMVAMNHPYALAFLNCNTCAPSRSLSR